MELTYNNGTAFFKIDSPDLLSKSVTRFIAEDVISFSITEELGKLPSGNLVIRDPAGIYAKTLRNGMRFDITFGYKAWNQNLLDASNFNKGFRGSRQTLKCFVMTPSGNGDEQGQALYNVTFMGLEYLKRTMHKTWESGKRSDVVKETMALLEIVDPIIDFPTANERISPESMVIQREAPVNFLYKLASDWGAYFSVAPLPGGTKKGLFIDPRKVKSAQVKSFIAQAYAIDDEKELFWNSGNLSNIKSFSWQQHIGEGGNGDGTMISYVDGVAVVQRYVVDSSGSVTLYQLNEKKVRDATKNGADIKKDSDILEAPELTAQLIHDYFDPIPSSLAPQGVGYTINVQMHGDPFIVILQKILFKGGFPPPLTLTIDGNAKLEFYVKRVTHNFSKGEYVTDMEIVDTFNLNGSYIGYQNQGEARIPGKP